MEKNRFSVLLLAVFLLLLALTFFRYQRDKTPDSETASGFAETEAPESRSEAVEGSGQSRNTAGAGESQSPDTAGGEESQSPDAPEEGAEAGAETDTEPTIRVLLCSDSFESRYHTQEDVVFLADYRCTTDLGETFVCRAGETFTFPEGGPKGEERGWTFEPVRGEGGFSLPLLERGYASPSYPGSLRVTAFEEGYLLCNTVALEDYLCRVVPSEMPARYPLEALKAQAVCARTYAVSQIQAGRLGKFQADVDDSVEFQVYNNLPEDEQSTRAVRETGGLVLKKNGELADARYYSTSCGATLSENLSQEAVLCAFLSGSSGEDYEKDEPWYRWTVSFSLEELTGLALEAGLSVGKVTGLEVEEREENGRAKVLAVKGKKGTARVEGEYAIRRFLKPAENALILQDGSLAPGLGMLPSAFFFLTGEKEGKSLAGYQITGGGYGHGTGMSQNGAKHMAEKGEAFDAILKYYYGEVTLYEEGSSDSETVFTG